jgi:iron-sulfur cluster assembly accessory protein
MTPDITVSPSANDYIKKMIEKEHGIGFRLSIKKTGCSGYSYLPSIVTQEIQTDMTCITEGGVTLFIDRAWLDLLQGIHVDYIEEEKAGLKQKRLVFTNPNESTRCGCGESFHIE